MDYDVLILGGGITGCAIAYELSKYNLNIALIEKDFDVADDISFVNADIVYDGSECKNDLMSTLESMGNKLIKDVSKKFNLPITKRPTLRIADDDESEAILDKMYARAKRRKFKDVELLDEDATKLIEPNVPGRVRKALYSKNTAVINPYELAIAYGEVAFENGVRFRLEEKVNEIQRLVSGFRVTTNKNKFTCKFVVNTIPGDLYVNDETEEVNESEKLMTYYLLLDNCTEAAYSNLIVKVEDENNYMTHIPSPSGERIIGINSEKSLGFYKSLRKAKSILPSISNSNVNNVFYDEHHKDIIIIDDNEINKGYIKITGKHYAEVTIAPAIASLVSESVVENLRCSKNNNFIDKRREFYRFRNLSNEQRNELVSVNDKYGKVICMCNLITEGEVIDCIRRPLGARTLEGVKRRTGATFGRCHGANCISKIIDILARELDKKPTEIVEDSKNSNLLASRIKEFDEI
ncbi:MAG: NAD(P)/FAD-dependent oxidoreductase [Sarcina sp.]